MILEIRRLQHALGMSDGELLRLAREVAHDGTLVSLGRLTRDQRRDLEILLTVLLTNSLELAHFRVA